MCTVVGSMYSDIAMTLQVHNDMGYIAFPSAEPSPTFSSKKPEK